MGRVSIIITPKVGVNGPHKKESGFRCTASRPRWVLALLLILILVGTQGCLIIPTPEHRAGWLDSSPPNTRQNLSKKSAKSIIPGKTQKADLDVSLGEPDAISIDGRRVVYKWETVVGWYVWCPAFENRLPHDVLKENFLIVDFDPEGMVVDRRVISSFWRKLCLQEVLDMQAPH